MDSAVLSADDQEVLQDECCAVPVVVPQGLARELGVERPQLAGISVVKCDDPKLVVARTGVDEWKSIGIDRDRPLDDVVGLEARENWFAGLGVKKVDRTIERPEHGPEAPVESEQCRLPRPTRTAPR